MAARKPIVVVGSVNADLILESRLPLAGETISATGGGITVAGGKGANQAATAGKLGYSTAFVGQTGRDAAGGMLREALGACGVSLQHTPAVSAPTGQAVIILQPDGENSIIIVGGANVAWQAPDAAALDAVRAAATQRALFCACVTPAPRPGAQVRSAGLLLLQREVPESVSIAAAEAAHAAGVPVILDAGGDETPIADALLRCVTYLSPNETELARARALRAPRRRSGSLQRLPLQARLTGMPTDGGDAAVQAAAAVLQARGVSHVLVKLGKHGSLLVPPAPAAPLRQPALRADKVRIRTLRKLMPTHASPHAADRSRYCSQVVDTTGAGDCFTAAFGVALMEGMPHAEALRFASAAACICVQRMGAMPSLPSRAEVDALLAAQK